MRNVGQQVHVADPAESEGAGYRAGKDVGDQQGLTGIERQRREYGSAAEDDKNGKSQRTFGQWLSPCCGDVVAALAVAGCPICAVMAPGRPLAAPSEQG